MTIKEQLILDILQVTEFTLLEELRVFMEQLKNRKGNCASVLAFSHALDSEEGQKIAQDLDDDFNNIEDDWK